MPGTIAIRNETKSRWERRAALTPDLVRRFVSSGLNVLVQPSARRVFRDKDYARAGAELNMDLSAADVIFGVKEVPAHLFEPDTAYVFFSHVIKGQPYNMGMLQTILDRRCTLIDYEMVRDDEGRRLIFFGRFAGLAGMIDTLWALGRRWTACGIATPLADLEPAHGYDSLAHAAAAIRTAGDAIASSGLPAGAGPLVIGVAGYGNVAKGAQEILSELPCSHITPAEALALGDDADPRRIYVVTFKEADLVESVDAGRAFELQHYYDHPEAYRSAFDPYLERLTVLVNANYWDERYPRLATLDRLREVFAADHPTLQVIGDLGCDIGGTIECTLKVTEPGDPVYVWDPVSGEIASGFDGAGPAILAVDILPTELPREASEEFSRALAPFVADIAKTNFSAPFDDLTLPAPIKRAVIAHRGELTPEFAYLKEHLDAAAGTPGDA
jgi:saccharopine dehydrogenase (NAD+, L-lysine-forming)